MWGRPWQVVAASSMALAISAGLVVVADVIVALIGQRRGPMSWRAAWGAEAALAALVLAAFAAAIPGRSAGHAAISFKAAIDVQR